MKTLLATTLAALLGVTAVLSHAAPQPTGTDIQKPQPADDDKDKDKKEDKKD
jgi:hypothetical protein